MFRFKKKSFQKNKFDFNINKKINFGIFRRQNVSDCCDSNENFVGCVSKHSKGKILRKIEKKNYRLELGNFCRPDSKT